MTEEDIMWQMENMDPDDLAALGYIPDEEEEEQEEEKAVLTPDQPIEQQDDTSSPSPGQPPKDDQLSEEEKVERFTVSEYKMRSRSSLLILVSFFYA
jgi:hypothetical protein